MVRRLLLLLLAPVAPLMACGETETDTEWRSALPSGELGGPDCYCPTCFDSCWAIAGHEMTLSLNSKHFNKLATGSEDVVLRARLGGSLSFQLPFFLDEMSLIEGRYELDLYVGDGRVVDDGLHAEMVNPPVVGPDEVEEVTQALNNNTHVTLHGRPSFNFVELERAPVLFNE